MKLIAKLTVLNFPTINGKQKNRILIICFDIILHDLTYHSLWKNLSFNNSSYSIILDIHFHFWTLPSRNISPKKNFGMNFWMDLFEQFL